MKIASELFDLTGRVALITSPQNPSVAASCADSETIKVVDSTVRPVDGMQPVALAATARASTKVMPVVALPHHCPIAREFDTTAIHCTIWIVTQDEISPR